ncbi:unnamed protein product [Lampetra fluviatilis]
MAGLAVSRGLAAHRAACRGCGKRRNSGEHGAKGYGKNPLSPEMAAVFDSPSNARKKFLQRSPVSRDCGDINGGGSGAVGGGDGGGTRVGSTPGGDFATASRMWTKGGGDCSAMRAQHRLVQVRSTEAHRAGMSERRSDNDVIGVRLLAGGYSITTEGKSRHHRHPTRNVTSHI